MRKQLFLIFLFFILNIVLSKKIPRADGDNDVANVNDSTGQNETGKVETGNVETGQGETGQNETGKVETGQGETGQGETGQGETGQGETGKNETSQGSTEQDTTKQDNTTKQDSTEQDSKKQDSTKQDSKNQDSNDNNNSVNIETVKSNVTTTYGEIDIEYIPTTPKDKTTVNLIMYFSSLFAILVLFCTVHSIVYCRPKVIAKRNEKKRLQHAKKVQNQMEMMTNSNTAESETNNYGMEELQEAKLKDNKSSPEASIDFLSYNASSTDCIINLDNNSSNNISFNRKKSSGSKKSYKKS